MLFKEITLIANWHHQASHFLKKEQKFEIKKFKDEARVREKINEKFTCWHILCKFFLHYYNEIYLAIIFFILLPTYVFFLSFFFTFKIECNVISIYLCVCVCVVCVFNAHALCALSRWRMMVENVIFFFRCSCCLLFSLLLLYSKVHNDFFFLLCFFSGDFLFICWTKSLNI